MWIKQGLIIFLVYLCLRTSKSEITFMGSIVWYNLVSAVIEQIKTCATTDKCKDF